MAWVLKTIPSCHLASSKSRAWDQSLWATAFFRSATPRKQEWGRKGVRWGRRESQDQGELPNWPPGIKYTDHLTWRVLSSKRWDDQCVSGQFIQGRKEGLTCSPSGVFIPAAYERAPRAARGPRHALGWIGKQCYWCSLLKPRRGCLPQW